MDLHDPISFYDDFRKTGQNDAIRLGWKSPESQQRNFTSLLQLIETRTTLAGKLVHDAGCGHGDLIPHLQSRDIAGYIGTDAMGPAIATARKRHQSHDFRHMDLLRESVPKADATLCIGSLAFYKAAAGKRLVERLWNATGFVLGFSMWWDLTPEFLLWKDSRKIQEYVVALGQDARHFDVQLPAVHGGEAYVVLVK